MTPARLRTPLAAPTPEPAERVVVFHYHLFKNAGTSVDEMLRLNFGERWVAREFEPRGNPALHAKDVANWLLSQPQAIAFSSHTAELPPPRLPGLRLIPIVLLRHPLDRIASAYAFERRQSGNGFGAVLARHTTLAGYVDVRLAMAHDRQCRDFHVGRLCRMFPLGEGSELERAQRALAALPFVGLVERFEASMQRLARMVREHYPDFRATDVAANSSRDPRLGLQERLAQMREHIGAERYEALLAANAADMALYDNACAICTNDERGQPVTMEHICVDVSFPHRLTLDCHTSITAD
ncbi:MAG TPA: hypothetical protein VGQ91_16635 [Ideonella sp.]|jgi:hypothetical protein|nr:hypothetical protein [Ideonella sp.]